MKKLYIFLIFSIIIANNSSAQDTISALDAHRDSTHIGKIVTIADRIDFDQLIIRGYVTFPKPLSNDRSLFDRFSWLIIRIPYKDIYKFKAKRYTGYKGKKVVVTGKLIFVEYASKIFYQVPTIYVYDPSQLKVIIN